jgi:hypothetical protein
MITPVDVTALEQLAGQRQAGAVAAHALAGLDVVVVVGAAGLRAVCTTSKQRDGPLARGVAGEAVLIELVDGDVQGEAADGVPEDEDRRASPSSGRMVTRAAIQPP